MEPQLTKLLLAPKQLYYTGSQQSMIKESGSA